MKHYWVFSLVGMIAGPVCSAQDPGTTLPDSLYLEHPSLHFVIENDSLYQHLEVAQFNPKKIWFDLSVCIKNATWEKDTLRADGILNWSGTYGPVVESERGVLMLPSEWCYSGHQIEVCLFGHDAHEARVKWLAPASMRMRRP